MKHMNLLNRLFGKPEEINGAERCSTYLYRWIIFSVKGRIADEMKDC